MKKTGNRAFGAGIAALLALSPMVTFAAGKDLNYLIGLAANYMNKALLILMGFAVIVFVYNVIRYFIRPNEKARAEGNKYLMWSIIGFFVILSFWGLVNVLENTFNLDNTKPSSWTDYFNIFPSNGGSGSGSSGGNSFNIINTN